ncbi:unnamed protein product [Macrosiphum euphorbiae]|uniref:THAP domain-containing protein 9 n=2 Tax=Macrosiphum euphorbiae TaxID=13131 RepID=A0AAV0Y6X3_9HEMI|nr:unnamed protein product [Macrosiphum euphorbiae]
MDNKRQIFGFVDMGIDGLYDHDDPPEAKNALVFIVVALNGYWKLPIGYFLIDSLNGKERANLLETAMSLLTEIKIKIYSITFDGAHVNTAMCTHLGAKFTLNNPKTFIEYKDTEGKEQQMFIFYDPAHMLKLIRNTFQNKKVIKNKNGQLIKWEYLVKLVDVQTNQKLHAVNKLTYRHIHFFNEKMNVRLAAQTLSQSVCDSLKFMSTVDSSFEDSSATSEFCAMINNAFDITNSRSKFSKKPFNKAISEETFEKYEEFMKEFKIYIKGLSFLDGTMVVNSQRKTGFLGLLFSL